jgi:acetyltransferase
MRKTQSIAVIGASASPHKVGHMIFKNLLTQGFAGDVYAVNAKGEEILGKKSFSTIGEIPHPVDMAVIVTPAPTVPPVLEQCIAKDVHTVLIISAGFSETHTEEGRALEEQLRCKLKDKSSQMRVIGPNCLGVLIPSLGLNASFAKDLPKPGPIALISQSGALAVALIDQSLSLGIGYSQILSIGNKTLTDECDALEDLALDPETKVIGLYLESIKDGRRFLDVARRIASKKPIVLLKSGVSDAGRKAASSHTGALAGSSASIDAACAQTGIHRAGNAEEFLMLLQTLSAQPSLRTKRIAVLTNAGGPGILATDAAEAAGLELPQLQAAIGNRLKGQLPSSASVGNPIDVLGDALCDRYSAALEATGDDAGIDGVVALLTPQIMTPVQEIATAIVDFRKRQPLMPIVACFMGGPSVSEGLNILMKGGIPHFSTPEAAVRAMATLLPQKNDAEAQPKRGARTRLESAKSVLLGHSGLLDEETTSKLFALYQLPQPAAKVASSADEAVRIATTIGFPVIAKISSPQILHKTDIGGVKGNLQNADDVHKAFAEIIANVTASKFSVFSSILNLGAEGNSLPAEASAKAGQCSILIQKHLPPGNEFIIGGLQDPSFGPMVMVGLGGIFAELFRDAVFRIAPIDDTEAYRMLTELKSWKLLLGVRGKARSDIDALARAIVAVGQMLHECPQMTELDCNPVLVSEKGIAIADAKVVIG